MHTEAHLFSVPNDCLWYDKLWGPSQRVVTLFKKVILSYPVNPCLPLNMTRRQITVQLQCSTGASMYSEYLPHLQSTVYNRTKPS